MLDNETNPADSARNLGVFFDSGLNFRQHISQVSSSCFYHIRDLKRMRKSLPLALAKQIAVALVTSKLDYCNSLSHEIPTKDLHKLQRAQNCLARVVTKAPRFSRSIPLLKSLDWQNICDQTKQISSKYHVSELSSVRVPFLFLVLLSGIYCLHTCLHTV